MVVDAAGLVDANVVKAGPTGSGTAQTAGDIVALINTVDDFLDTEIAAIKAKTDNLPEGIQKNTALSNFVFFMVDSTDHVTGKTGLTVTAQRSLDGAAFAAAANSVSEIASGFYKINLAAGDLNADTVALKFTASGADATVFTIKTES